MLQISVWKRSMTAMEVARAVDFSSFLELSGVDVYSLEIAQPPLAGCIRLDVLQPMSIINLHQFHVSRRRRSGA